MKQDIPRLEAYLRKVYGARTLTVKAVTADKAEVAVGPRKLGTIVADTEDGETTYQFQWTIREAPQPFSPQELVRVQTYLREVLGTKNLSVRARGRLKDSAEVYVGDDSYALVSADKDCYQFNMAILDIDLDEM